MPTAGIVAPVGARLMPTCVRLVGRLAIPVFVFALGVLVPGPGARGDEEKPEDEFKGLPHEEKKAGDDARKRYFLIGPREAEKAPAKGHPLLVVLPGGDGGEAFLP